MKHARDRQAERNISDQEVEYVLAHWTINRTDKKGNRVLSSHPNNRYIKVVVAQDSNPPFIITVAD